MAKLNLTNIVDELKKKYQNYVNSPFIQKYNQKVNQPIYNATNKVLNFGANIPRFQISRDLIGKAIPATKTPVGQTLTNIALGIPESIVNIPRNLTVGYSRLQKENLGAVRQASTGQKIIPNWTNVAAGVAPLAEAGLDIASFGTVSNIAKQGGKELIKGGVGQAFKQGAKSGALYGGAGGLAYAVGNQYNQKFNAKEALGGALMGASLGGLLGGTVSSFGALKRLTQYDDEVLSGLRNFKGQWKAGQQLVKPAKMPQAQWDFQLKFNKTWNRNPYEPVFQKDLQQAIKIEAERKAPALQVRDINKDKIRGTLPKSAEGKLYDVPKEIQPLAEEAKKYPNAESFINAYKNGEILKNLEYKAIQSGPEANLVFGDLGVIGTKKTMTDKMASRIVASEINPLKSQFETPKVTTTDINKEIERLYQQGKDAGYGWASKPLSSNRSRLEKQAIDNLVARSTQTKVQNIDNILKSFYEKSNVPQAGLYDTKKIGEVSDFATGTGYFIKLKDGNFIRGFKTKTDAQKALEQVAKNVAQQPIGDVKANVVEPEAKIVPSSPTQITSNKPTALQTSDSGLVQTQQPKVTTQKLPQESKQIQSQSGDLNDQKIKTYKFNILDRLYTEFANRFHPLSKLAKSGGKDAELNRKIAGYYGSGSTADYHLNFELSPILKGQNLDDLKSASIAMRDIELASRKIKGSPEQANATKILDNLKAKYGEDGMKKLGETLNALYKYQDDIARKYLVDTGIMSNASYEKMRGDNSFYVPFKRVSEKVDEFLGIPVKRGAGSVGSQNVIFKIKGSDKELIDPIESIIENTYKMVSLGKRQQLAQTVAGLAKELPELVQKTKLSGLKDTISVFENGKKVNYLVPTEVADAARGMSEESLVMLAKILKVPTDLFRTMTTGINPEFLLPNVSRDIQSAVFNTGVNPLKWIAGLYHYAKQDAVYQDFLKAGGKTSRVSINRQFLKQTAEEVAGQGFKIRSPKDIIRGLEMLSQYSEQPTRINVFQDAYKKALKQGMSQEDALSEAAYWAQEGTVNFARRGSKMPNINAIYAYLNARIQGIDRMFRTVKKEPGKAALRFGVSFLAPSLALYAWNSQNPDYYDERILSKRDKQDNFIFMLPKPVGEIRYLKIPKAEVGKIVNPIEESLDFARGKGGDVWSSIGSVLKSFSPIDNWGGVIPTAINPLVENAFNKDFYTGYDLVPEYKKNYPKGYQDSSYTGPLYRFVGQKLNMSPAKIQNFAEGYGGGMMRIADWGAGKLLPDKYTSAKNEQGADINRAPVIRRFMGGEKKTEEEQIKANESRINAINFDINDIKAGVKRGDIPMDVGVKKIEELQKQQSDLSSSIGSKTGTKTATGQNLRWIQTSDGALKQIDFNFTVPDLKLTGNETLDKEIKSDYNGEITSLKNDVMTALEAGAITQEEAIKQLEKLNTAKNKTKKAKKPKKITFKTVKYKAPKITIKKKASIKLPTLKVKKPKKIKIVRKYTIKA